jgi:glycosyltransferase involved in cell wall biosynthesis
MTKQIPNSTAASGSEPLVSVGIPTFNRPEGVRRTLELICGQTYPNLEIIVSDNASKGKDTETVVSEFAAKDCRIKYFRQADNIGPTANFRFVLEQASGAYFMWAADDDEWDARFIETCLAASSGLSCSVMTRFNTVFRGDNTYEENPVPFLSPELALRQNVENYFSNMQPSLLYGLHPRSSVLSLLNAPDFDFYDCYVVLRIILKTGFRTIDQNLFSAGIDAPAYEIKYMDTKKKQLEFSPFFWRSAMAILRCSQLSLSEKAGLLLKLTQTVRTLRKHHAGHRL